MSRMVYDYYTETFGLSSDPRRKRTPNWLSPARMISGQQILLSRGLCSFDTRPLPMNLRGEKLKRSLELAAQLSSPYESTGIFVTVGESRASIWTYDADKVQTNPNVAVRHLIPETALHAPADGLVLRQVLEGYEGQYWRDGELFASRWWSGAVSESEWQKFCLSAERFGADIEPRPAPILPQERGSRPSNAVPLLSQFGLVSVRAWIVMLLFAVVVSSGYFGLRFVHLKMQSAQMTAEYERLWTEKSDLRASALQLNALDRKTVSLSRIFNVAHPLPALTDAITAALSADGQIQRIFYDGYAFEVDFRREDAFSQRDFVAELELSAYVANVSLVQGQRPDLWELTFTHPDVGAN